MVTVYSASPASAQTCGAAVGAATGLTTPASAGATLPFTGSPVMALLLAGALLLLIGAGFLRVSRYGVRAAFVGRTKIAFVAVVIATIVLGGGAQAGSVTVRSAVGVCAAPAPAPPVKSPIGTTPVADPASGSSGADSTANPSAVVPESPLPVLLPITAAALAWAAIRRPRRGLRTA